MKAYQLFSKEFNKKNLFQTYHKYISITASKGVDGISKIVFEKGLSSNLSTINDKVFSNTYKFSPYIAKLLLRNYKKIPRIIEKPSIKDKLVLRCIYQILAELYKENLNERSLHSQINSLISEYQVNSYNAILRFDIKDYYPSINHAILMKSLKYKIRKPEIINLIRNALKTPNTIIKKEGYLIRNKGIPQGLSISNALANIYFFKIDKKYKQKNNLCYYRFVDDILILCNSNNKESISKSFIRDCNKIDLNVHKDEKYINQGINDPFDFLGYSFYNKIISIRKKSQDKIREKIIKICSSYKYSKKKDLELFRFKLNLKITGCIYNDKKYGWLFYFSQTNDLELIHSLDHFVKVQIKRFIHQEIEIKRFSKTFYQIRYNLNKTKYIPNFNNYTKAMRKKLLELNSIKFNAETIEVCFEQLINKEIRDLERDLSSLS